MKKNDWILVHPLFKQSQKRRPTEAKIIDVLFCKKTQKVFYRLYLKYYGPCDCTEAMFKDLEPSLLKESKG